MLKKLFSYIFFLISIHSFAINIDSLENVLQSSSIDSAKISAYHLISWELKSSDPDKALEYANNGYNLAEKNSDKNGMESCINNIGVIKAMQGKFDESIESFKANLELNIELNKKEGEATANNNLGLVYYYKGAFSKAVEHYITALNIYDEIEDEDGKASSYNNLGLIYENQKEYEKSLFYQKKALKIRIKQGDPQNLAFSYGNIGNIYYLKEIRDTALIYFLKAETLFNQANDKFSIGQLIGNIGKIYQDKKEYDKAVEYFEKGISIQKELNDGYGMAVNLLNISEAKTLNNELETSIRYALLGIKKAEEIKARDIIKQGYSSLMDTYYKAKDYKKAFEYSEKLAEIKDSIFSEESQDKIADLETKYDSEQKEKENELLRKDGALKDLELDKSKIINYGVSSALVVFSILGMFIYKEYNDKKKAFILLENKNEEIILQKDVIEQKNTDILDSLNYAKRIQYAILPPKNYVDDVLPDSFIYYNPKDIVSGDFYWVDTIGEKVVFAAVDCTGHGVPGAFMSIVGYNGLNQVINAGTPADILDELNELVSNTLHQTQNTQIKEGMDISLCVLDFKNLKLDFAGAYNSLFIVRGNELIEKKGNRFSIGSKHYRGDKKYDYHSVDLEKGDMIYLTTDGYLDQFGENYSSKYMVYQFRKLILSIADKDSITQKEIITNTFQKWKGDEGQIDDVCVFGVRI